MVTLLTETKDPEKAQAAVMQMDKLAEEWALKLHEAEKGLKSVEASSGDTVLASIINGNDESQATATTLANARAQYDIALKTLASVERHQVIAKANLKLAKAHQLRLQAAEKGKEREAHLIKVNAMLGELAGLEGAPYVPFKPQRLQGGYSDPVPHAVPLSEAMERQIKDLLFQAEQLESSAKSMLAKANARQN